MQQHRMDYSILLLIAAELLASGSKALTTETLQLCWSLLLPGQVHAECDTPASADRIKHICVTGSS